MYFLHKNEYRIFILFYFILSYLLPFLIVLLFICPYKAWVTIKGD
jgi:hypothetical protein